MAGLDKGNMLIFIVMVFICYAREDQTMAYTIRDRLKTNAVDSLGDWLLVAAIKYEEEIKQFILRAGLFMYVISPDSIRSQACRDELAFAVANRKVILPVLYRDHRDDKELDPAIRSPQWVYMRNESELTAGIPEVIRTLRTDFALMDQHAALLLDADKWVQHNRSRGYLLVKDQLRKAQDWLEKAAIDPERLPKPTPVQVELILASQRNKTRAGRVFAGAVGCVGLVLLCLAVVAWLQRNRAQTETRIAMENLRRFEVEQFQRNIRNGNVYFDAEEYCMAKKAFDSAWSVATDTLCARTPEVTGRKVFVDSILAICRQHCPL